MLQFLLRKVLISATIEEKIAQQKGWFHKRVPGKNQMKAVMGGWFVFFLTVVLIFLWTHLTNENPTPT